MHQTHTLITPSIAQPVSRENKIRFIHSFIHYTPIAYPASRQGGPCPKVLYTCPGQEWGGKLRRQTHSRPSLSCAEASRGVKEGDHVRKVASLSSTRSPPSGPNSSPVPSQYLLVPDGTTPLPKQTHCRSTQWAPGAPTQVTVSCKAPWVGFQIPLGAGPH